MSRYINIDEFAKTVFSDESVGDWTVKETLDYIAKTRRFFDKMPEELS